MAIQVSRQLATTVDQLRFEPTELRVRAFVDGELVADSRRALLVWEPGRIVPLYAVPEEDLSHGVTPSATTRSHTADGEVVDVATAGGTLAGAGFRLHDPDLDGAVLLAFSAFDEWLVEDEPRVGHPHDPFKRISVHGCARQVEVALEGTVLASSSRTLLLMETHLPPRYYIPPEDVRRDLLEPSSNRSVCAYKGFASYVSLPGVAEDIAWHYEEPLAEVARIRGHYCFWSERSDLFLDGELQPRPVSVFSRPPEPL